MITKRFAGVCAFRYNVKASAHGLSASQKTKKLKREDIDGCVCQDIERGRAETDVGAIAILGAVSLGIVASSRALALRAL